MLGSETSSLLSVEDQASASKDSVKRGANNASRLSNSQPRLIFTKHFCEIDYFNATGAWYFLNNSCCHVVHVDESTFYVGGVYCFCSMSSVQLGSQVLEIARCMTDQTCHRMICRKTSLVQSRRLYHSTCRHFIKYSDTKQSAITLTVSTNR